MKRKNVRRKLRGIFALDELNLIDKDGNIDVSRLRNPAQQVEIFDDFIDIADGTIWVKQDTSANGSPTWALVADTHGGEFAMTLAATNEAESLTIYLGDQRIFAVDKKPVFEAKIKVSTIAANQRVVFGLAGDRNATLDNVAQNAWFRIEGNMNILVETDDGTTDNDDNDTTVDAVNGTYAIYQVDLSNLADIKFRINGVDYTPETMNLSALTTQTLQAFVELQKDSGTGTPAITIDWIRISANR
jgi:hypothetical protein